MKRFFAPLLLVALLLLGQPAVAQQFFIPPRDTTINAVPYDSDNSIAARVERVSETTPHSGGNTNFVAIDSTRFAIGIDGATSQVYVYKSGAYLQSANLTTAGSIGDGLCLGPDGRVWGTKTGAKTVFAYDPTANSVTEYALATTTAFDAKASPIVGPDGNLWIPEITNTGSAPFCIVSTAGALVAETSIQSPASNLVLGADNRVWYATQSAALNAMDSSYVTSSVSGISNLPVHLYAASNGYIYVLGPLLWRKYDTTMNLISSLAIPNSPGFISTQPYAFGPAACEMGGAIWVTEGLNNRIISVDPTTDKVSEYSSASFALVTALTQFSTTQILGVNSTGTGFLFTPAGALATRSADKSDSSYSLYAVSSNVTGASVIVDGYSTAVVSVTGTFSATVNFEASVDNSTWVSILGTNTGTTAMATSTASAGDWQINVSGYRYLRARVSGYASGSVTALAFVSRTANTFPGAPTTQAVNLTQVLGAAHSAANPVFNTPSIAGAAVSATNGDYSNLLQGNAVLSATNGLYANVLQGNAALSQTNGLPVEPVPSKKATYSVAYSGAVATSATDIFTLTGSATKTVKVLSVSAAYSNAASTAPQLLSLIRRSSANSGGTSATVTAAALDTNNAATTCTSTSYTVNPAGLGAAVATIASVRQTPMNTSINAGNTVGQSLFQAASIGQPIVLRGTSDILTINGAGTSAAGNNITLTVVYTEE